MIVAILCVTFLVVLVVYCILPINKMKAVNRELKSLLQVLPISQIMKSCRQVKVDKEP